MSELGLTEIKGDLIEANARASGDFRTIQVKLDPYDKHVYPIVVDLDCTYVVSHDTCKASRIRTTS